MSGWITIHRRWRDSEFFDLYKQSVFSEREAWLWMIEFAAWKDTKRNSHRGAMIEIKRGQIHTSLKALQTVWGWDKKRVERFLGRLEQWGMVSSISDVSGRTITISNYDKYQSNMAENCHSESGKPDGKPLGRKVGNLSNDKQSEKDVLLEAQGKLKGSSRETQEQDNKFEQVTREERNIWRTPPDGVDADVWRDLLRNRKTKRLTNTQTAYDKMMADIAKLEQRGFTRNQLVGYAAAKGWGAIYEPSDDSKRKSAGNGRGSNPNPVYDLWIESTRLVEQHGFASGDGDEDNF